MAIIEGSQSTYLVILIITNCRDSCCCELKLVVGVIICLVASFGSSLGLKDRVSYDALYQLAVDSNYVLVI